MLPTLTNPREISMPNRIIRWEPPLYGPREFIADVPGVGRYHVRRLSPRLRGWIVRLNGRQVAGPFDTAQSAMDSVVVEE